MQKSLMHFETCRDMQMITHEILRNYCISFRISACVQPENDKNEFSELRGRFFAEKRKVCIEIHEFVVSDVALLDVGDEEE